MQNISFFLLASSLFVFACGGSDGTTPIPAVVEPADGEPTESTPAPTEPASTCNTITNDAKPVSEIAVLALDAPPPMGGAIPSGTFHLASVTLFAGKKGQPASIPITLQGTVKVAGDSVEQVLDGKRPDGTTLAERSTETFTTNGGEVTFTKTCDGTGSRTGTFTATSSTLLLFLVNDVGQTVAYEYR